MPNQADGRFVVRRATTADVDVLARHRCDMFKDMGQLRDEVYPALAEASRAYFEQALATGEYHAWLVSARSVPSEVVAGGGIQLRDILPRPGRDGFMQPAGKQALIVNVYTEKAWRRQGIAENLIRVMLAWCHETGVASVVLHASEMGRQLYERLGFRDSNEMYLAPEKADPRSDDPAQVSGPHRVNMK